MNRLSHSLEAGSDDVSATSQLNQDVEDHVRALRALTILLESRLIDRSEFDRRASIFTGTC